MITPNTTLTGSGKERGIQYGAHWKETFKSIKPHMEINAFWDQNPDAKEIVKKKMMEATEKCFPDLAAEIEGMVEASDVSISTILDWVLLDAFSWGLEPNPDLYNIEPMCTNLSIIGSCAEPMLTQTMDAPDGSLLIVHKITPDDGYNHIYLGRLGSVNAVNGINEKGLAIGCVSSFASGQNMDGFMYGMLVRACLQYSANVEEAVAMFTKHDLMFGGYTFNCLDSDNNNVVIEKMPGKQAIRLNEGAYMFNTKFVTDEMRKANAAWEPVEKRGYDRLDTFQRLMEKEATPYTQETLVRVMSDHSTPGPIWTWTTMSGTIMFPKSGKLLHYLGPPDVTVCEVFTV